MMNEKKPTWTCPVCDSPARYDDLMIDGYFEEVIKSPLLPDEENEIILNQDGSWNPVPIDEEAERKKKEKEEEADVDWVKGADFDQWSLRSWTRTRIMKRTRKEGMNENKEKYEDKEK